MVKEKRKSDPAGGEGGGGGGGGAKRRRRGRREAPTDRISKLPDDMLEEILERLAFMDAVRSGALSHEWRRVYKEWRRVCKSFPPRRRRSVQICLDDHDALERELKALEREPRPCLHRFSLVVETRKFTSEDHESFRTFTSKDLKSFLKHAAECGVEELHIDMWKASGLTLPLKHLSPHLARLSLHRCSSGISSYQGSQALSALEVIELYRVDTPQSAFKKKLFPRLRILDLLECNISFKDSNKAWPASLRSVTVVGCEGRVNLEGVPSLRSFSFSGSFHDAPFSLPRDATLSSLYLNFGSSGIPNSHHLKNALPNDLSGLNVLTVCSNTLSVLSSVSDDGATCDMPKQRSLHSLRELQLLMFKMEPANLADIYVFLKTFQCPNLERLFVKLPPDLKEGSQHDEVRAEPPEDGLHNLKIVKVNDFNWSRAEVLLVSFLLREASSLHKMLLVSHNVAPVDIPGVQEADLLLIEEAWTNGKLLLSKSDDAATQPYHSGKLLLSKSDDAATQPYHSKDVDPSLPPKNQQYFYVQDLSVRQSREAFSEGLLRDAGTQPYHSKDVDSSLPQKNHSLLGPEI